ncbi:MAG: toprim domain-containing protein [Clostridiales bacterium]|nr:toprim domain-containing protein [Clostridiales bacterium]
MLFRNSQVYICFDNDPPGQKAAKCLRQKLFEKGINSEILIPAQGLERGSFNFSTGRG